jgi:ribosomal protein L7Ae-like RNA K-turn-binding protein
MGLLGLGFRAGNVIAGVEGVRQGLQRDDYWCIVLASDASARAVEKVQALARAREVPIVAGPSADTLGARLGKPPVMVVGVRDRSLANGIMNLKAGE